MMEAASVPASIPAGGREGSLRTFSHPSWKLMKVIVLTLVAKGARLHTFAA